MVIISTAVDDADPLAANNFDTAPAWSLFDVVYGTTADVGVGTTPWWSSGGASSSFPLPSPPPLQSHGNDLAMAPWSLFDVVYGTAATADVGAGTTPWWSSHPPCYEGSGGASSPFPLPPPPPLQSHGNDLACFAGSIMDMDTFSSFPQLPAPPVYMQPEPELSYLYCPQTQLRFPSCFPAPLALEPATIRPPLLVPTTQPASMPPSSLYYPQTQATATGSASVEEASAALADTQQAQEDGTRPAPRRRGRPSKRAPAVSEPPPVSKPTKRVAVGRNRAASSSQKTSSAATGSATAGHVPDQAGATGSTRSTSGQAAACTSTKSPMALLCEERCQPQPDFSNGASTGVEQAAIAPPEAMVTGPRQYADTSDVGVRFHPTDQELIGYLRWKYARQQMPVEFFKELDVYQAHPMAIKGACGESQNGCWYAFSPRNRKYRNGERPERSVFAEGGGQQVGFWKSNSNLSDVHAGGKKNGAVIGRMTTLTFHLGRQPRGEKTGWKMREYTIPENQHQPDGSAMLLNDWVVCKLFYKERSTCTNTEIKTEENAVSVGQKRPRRSRKSKKDKNAIQVAVGQEDGPGEAAGESVQVQGEEDVKPQMAPAAHQASDYSEQELCVEDYLVCDVEFAQHNDAANCTI